MGVETVMLAAALASAGGTALETADAWQRSRYQQAVARSQAEAARNDAGIEAQLILEDSAREIGRGITLAAKGGAGGGGSAFDVLADLSRQNIYEVQRAAITGGNAARAAEAEAREAGRAGKFALISGTLKTGAQIAGASNASGDGTLLSDWMERRRARGGVRPRGPAPVGAPARSRTRVWVD